jgi:hypothetical protein
VIGAIERTGPRYVDVLHPTHQDGVLVGMGKETAEGRYKDYASNSFELPVIVNRGRAHTQRARFGSIGLSTISHSLSPVTWRAREVIIRMYPGMR